MSFYTDMAAMATEMIAEYGMTVTLRFNNGTYDPASGTKTTSNTDAPTTGLFLKINDALRQDFTLQENDRVLLVDASVAPSKNCGVLVGGENIKCVEFKTIKPTDAAICYFLQVRK